MVWHCHLLKNFPQFIVIHTVKSFGIVNRAEIDVFFWNSCFFNDPADVGNLISGSSAFSKTSLNISKFTVHVLLKPGLENFEHQPAPAAPPLSAGTAPSAAAIHRAACEPGGQLGGARFLPTLPAARFAFRPQPRGCPGLPGRVLWVFARQPGQVASRLGLSRLPGVFETGGGRSARDRGRVQT